MKILIPLLFGTLSLSAEHHHKASPAAALIQSLTDEQKSETLFPLASEERENWHYFPKERKGLRIDKLNEAQSELLKKLLHSTLGEQGQLTAKNVEKLEAYLYEKSAGDDFRNPNKYFLSLFGTPDAHKPWGFRYEGHHLSLNFTIKDGETVLTTPFFFGTNPAEVPDGKHKGLRPLGTIEDAARKLAHHLQSENHPIIFTQKPPREILTAAKRVAEPVTQEGLAYTALKPAHQEELLKLTNTIAANQKHLEITADDLASAHFAWAGSLEPKEPHYFRIQSAEFLIEYANTQNGANHAHLVWRNFKDDFGRDTLAEHFQEHH